MKNEHRKERISSFEDLEAWQMARQLVNAIYALSRIKSLSKDFRLCSQIQSAGISIMSNIWPVKSCDLHFMFSAAKRTNYFTLAARGGCANAFGYMRAGT